jgi:hypothetical protein
MTDLTVSVEQHLTDLRAALAADGYRLSVTDARVDALSLDIAALDDACPDCLVPPSLMETIVRAAIPNDAQFTTIYIKYPAALETHG